MVARPYCPPHNSTSTQSPQDCAQHLAGGAGVRVGGASAPQPTTLQTLQLLLKKPPQCGHNPGIAPHERRFHSRPKVLPPTPRAVPDVPLDALNVPERARAALPRAVYRLTRIPSQAKLLVYR